MTNCKVVNIISGADLLSTKSAAIALPPLASRLVKREAKSLSLALLKAKDNSDADGKG